MGQTNKVQPVLDGLAALTEACVWAWRTVTMTLRAGLTVMPGALGATAAIQQGRMGLAAVMVVATVATVTGLVIVVALWVTRDGGAR